MRSKILQRLGAALLLLGVCLAGKTLHAQTYTFTNAGATGTNGPSQVQVTNAYSSTSLAGNVTVTGSGIQNWSVPVSGLYKIEVYGANGYGPFAGRGAYMSGEFNFNAADILKILVGQQGGCCVGSGTEQFGGGGGSFVADATNNPLIIAGGGGGVNGATTIPAHSDANITTNGNAGVGTTSGSVGGTNGGGGGGIASAGGGGGFLGDGGVTAGFPGGFAFLNGGVGGTSAGSGGWGGFGGGGGANSFNNRRAGGGGGYSGGGGAGSSTTASQEGGGGGSYNTGTNQVNTPAMGTGHGSVVITLLVPAVMVPNNTGVTGFPSLTTGICPGVQTVSVKVRNYGNNFVSSVKIAWEVNGVLQTDLVYPVALDPYPGPVYEQTVTVGTYNFIPGSASVKAWTSLPNNQPDGGVSNDTATYSVPVSLTGTYTLNSGMATGGTNYQTFTDFANDLSNNGICGPVTLDVMPGSGPYNEQFTIPQVTGSSATNTITINGNGATLGFGSANANQRAVITLDGADYVTIDSLIIDANTGTYGWGVLLTNAADNNVISSCIINTSPTVTTAYNYLGIALSGSTSTPLGAGNSGNNNIITGNTIIGGYYNIVLYGNSIANGQCLNNVVSNNILQEAYSYATYLAYQSGAVISGNDISRPTRTSSTTTAGVFLTTGCINTLVEKNRIHNMYGALSTNTGTIYGVYVGADGLSGQENKIFNNLIYNINHNGPIYGVYNTGGDYMQVYHNTISLDHAAATAGATYGMYQVTASTGIDYRNNMITIARGGSGAKYGFYFSTAGSTHTSNYNNVYLNSLGSGAQYYGYYGGTNYATLANWQTANLGIYDAMSLNADPFYMNPAGGDFTPSNPSVDNLGTPLTVLTDINGLPRDPVTPDMGAYEVPNAPCSTPPTPGFAAANPTSGLCGGDNIFLNLSGFSGGSGQSYMWEESVTTGGPFTAITGSLQSPGTNIQATTTKYYRAAVTCGTSTTYSSEVLVTVGAINGTAATSLANICIGGSTVLSLTGHTGNVQWEYYDNNTASWLPEAGATTANYTATNLQATTDYRAAVSCASPTGTVYSNTVNVTVTNPSIAEVFPGARCDAGPVTLAAKGSAGTTVKWYDASTGGTLLGTGGAYTTPAISNNTTYYAAASTGSTATVGPNDLSIGTYAAWNSTAQWLNFTVISPTTIQSVDMFFSGSISSPFSIVIRDAGTLANVFTYNGTVSVASTTTAQVVPINAVLPPGNYQMNFGTTTGTYRNNTGGVYPYTVPGVISITGNTFDPLYYYMFYRWVVGASCEGTRVPVAATITGAPSGTGVATGGTTTGANQLDGTIVNYVDGCNDKVVTIADAAGGNTLGVTSAITLTSPTIQTLNGAPFVPRAFDISPSSSGPATVTLYALQSEFTAYNSYVTSNSLNLPLLPTGPLDAAGIANIKITQFHGNALAGTTGPLGLYDATNASFISTGITATWTGQHWAVTFPVNGFSGFFIHSGSHPLLIDLKDISATNVANRNRVDWSTVSETSGDLFDVQRSTDGTSYTTLATINARGEASTYSYWDQTPVTGRNFYRLYMKDASGKGSYSREVVATVRASGEFTISAHPNPVADNLQVVTFGTQGINPMISVLDVTGKLINTISVTGTSTHIKMGGLAKGIYMIRYTDNNRTETIRVNKQ